MFFHRRSTAAYLSRISWDAWCCVVDVVRVAVLGAMSCIISGYLVIKYRASYQRWYFEGGEIISPRPATHPTHPLHPPEVLCVHRRRTSLRELP